MTKYPHILVLLMTVLLSVGCSDEMDELPFEYMEVAGVERNFALFVPENVPEEPMPLLVAFHGGGMMYEAFPQQAAFQDLAESEGFIIAYPRGYNFPDNEGEWQLNTAEGRTHDTEFVAAMIERITGRYAIDETRIYATGYSLGSMFTYEVACQMSDQFAAIASFAGTMPANHESCNLDRFAPVMHIHGTDDSIISYSDSWGWKAWDEVGAMMPIPALMDYWSTKYACQNMEDDPTEASPHSVYSECAQDARVEHHRIEGQGHGWPSSINGTSTHQVIWNFVSEYTL